MNDYNTIYGLYSIDTENNESIIHAISTNKIILEKMIPTEYPTYVKFEIKNVVCINLHKTEEKIEKTHFTIELKNGYLNYIDNSIIGKMYCFASNKYNLTHNILAEHNDQIIINFSHLTNIEEIDEIKKIRIFQNNISENPIEFDTYYEDGLMNA
jgi:hypothetical protein